MEKHKKFGEFIIVAEVYNLNRFMFSKTLLSAMNNGKISFKNFYNFKNKD